MSKTYPIGIHIQVSAMIPSIKKPGKGVVVTRAEDTAVMVDPTDQETMMTVIRGCLVNAQITIPEDMIYADDNEMYEVDLECPECKRAKEKGDYKPKTAREKRVMAIADELVGRGIAVDAESAFEQAENIVKKERQIVKDERSQAKRSRKVKR